MVLLDRLIRLLASESSSKKNHALSLPHVPLPCRYLHSKTHASSFFSRTYATTTTQQERVGRFLWETHVGGTLANTLPLTTNKLLSVVSCCWMSSILIAPAGPLVMPHCDSRIIQQSMASLPQRWVWCGVDCPQARHSWMVVPTCMCLKVVSKLLERKTNKQLMLCSVRTGQMMTTLTHFGIFVPPKAWSHLSWTTCVAMCQFAQHYISLRALFFIETHGAFKWVHRDYHCVWFKSSFTNCGSQRVALTDLELTMPV